MDALPTLLAALVLAVVPLLPRYLSRLGDGGGRWLSVAGGVAVAFVFVRLVPELAERRDAVHEAMGAVPVISDVHEFALLGLLLFYGIEVLARRSRTGDPDAYSWPDHLAIGLFALYCALIGDFLWEQAQQGLGALALYTVVMGLHLLVVDAGLRRHHRGAYLHGGRWLLAGALLAGWAVGGLVTVPDAVEGLLLSLLAGAIVLVALKEELPAEHRSRFGWFAGGALLYSVLVALL